MRTFGRSYPHNSPYAGAQGVGAYYSPNSGDANGSRLLYHSGLLSQNHRIAVYPKIPDETTNFTHDIHGDRKVAYASTLSSMMISKYQQVLEETVIREIFRNEGGLSISWDFIHKIERMWLNDPDWDAGEFLLWRPFDRNMKAYAVVLSKLLVNGEQWEPEYRGSTRRVISTGKSPDHTETIIASNVQERIAINTFEIHFSILAELPPGGSVFAVGGSSVAEPALFNINEVV